MHYDHVSVGIDLAIAVAEMHDDHMSVGIELAIAIAPAEMHYEYSMHSLLDLDRIV